ncbi:MAG: multicopper oxidase type 3, partial [Thermomicrobiales bacterium]|nr:multicopper oxidase type 3 [Thermomicrobiales bacterium]
MNVLTSRTSRRNAAGLLGLLGVSAVGAAAAPARVEVHAGTALTAAHASGDHDSMLLKSAPATQSEEPTADEMDAMHEAGVAAFPAPTEGLGGQPLEFTMDGDVKVFDLVCQIVDWEVTPGKRVEAWTYNGVTPGPEIRVTEGDKVRFNVTNELPQS